MKTLYIILLLPWALLGCNLQLSTESPESSFAVIINSNLNTAPVIGSRVGNRAPNFTLPDLNGTQVTLSTLNTQPIYLNFCDPNNPISHLEMTKIDSLHKAMGQWITIVGVCSNTTAQAMQNYIEQNGYTWTFLIDPEQTIRTIYNFKTLPANLFINKYGIITERSDNPLRLKDMDRYTKRTIGVNN